MSLWKWTNSGERLFLNTMPWGDLGIVCALYTNDYEPALNGEFALANFTFNEDIPDETVDFSGSFAETLASGFTRLQAAEVTFENEGVGAITIYGAVLIGNEGIGPVICAEKLFAAGYSLGAGKTLKYTPTVALNSEN